MSFLFEVEVQMANFYKNKFHSPSSNTKNEGPASPSGWLFLLNLLSKSDFSITIVWITYKYEVSKYFSRLKHARLDHLFCCLEIKKISWPLL